MVNSIINFAPPHLLPIDPAIHIFVIIPVAGIPDALVFELRVGFLTNSPHNFLGHVLSCSTALAANVLHGIALHQSSLSFRIFPQSVPQCLPHGASSPSRPCSYYAHTSRALMGNLKTTYTLDVSSLLCWVMLIYTLNSSVSPAADGNFAPYDTSVHSRVLINPF